MILHPRNGPPHTHPGAAGERRVIETLSVLDDSYHVFWNVRVAGYPGGQPTQLDLVVVGPTGVFLIEVKNWSDEYASNPHQNPHRQTETAGRTLWLALHGVLRGVSVHNTLVAIHGNIRYDPSYPVYVTTPDRIAGFVVDRSPVLSPADVNRLADWLRGYLSTTDW